MVTAQKRVERLVDVPVSVTAVSGDVLTLEHLESPADLRFAVPGFTYRLSQYGTPIYAIRGIGFYDEQVGSSPTVGIYVDQIVLPYSRMAEGAALDAERVEVLKGPQGTTFGQNSTGGLVNYIAAKPTSTPQAALSISEGTFNHLDVEGSVSGPIVNDVEGRFAFQREQSDGWQVSRTRDDRAGRRDFLVARQLIDWTPNEALTVEFNVNGWRDRSDQQVIQARGYLPVNSAPPDTPVTTATAYALSTYPYYTGNDNTIADWDASLNLARDDRFYQTAVRVEYRLSGATRLVSLTSFASLKTYSPIDTDGTDYPAHFIAQIGAIDTFANENRLEGDGGVWSWAVGENYSRSRTSDFEEVTLNGSNAQLGGVHFDSLKLYNKEGIREASVFAHVDFHAPGAITLSSAVRYTAEDIDFSGCMADSGKPLGFRIVLGAFGIQSGQCITFGPTGKPGLFNSSLDQHNWSYRESLDWKPTDDSLLYASVTRGFKSGSYDSLPAVSYTQLIPVTQESITAYEVGFKAAQPSGLVGVSGAAFYYDYANKQVAGYIEVAPFGNLPNLINIPRSRVIGSELDLTVRPVEGLRATIGAAYLDSKVLGTALVSSPFGNTVNAGGEAFPATPAWQLQSMAEYIRPVNAIWRAYVAANALYRTATNAAFGSASGPVGTQDFFAIRSYGLLDVQLGFRRADGRFGLELYGNNVTGTNYWNNVVHVYDTYGRVAGMPATLGVRVSTHFQ